MAWANWVGGVWTCALLGVLTAFVGCNGSTSSNSCISYCDNLCSSLEACDVELKDCRGSCEGELTDKACKGQPAPDRLTCAELTEAVACAEYCTALCDRAPSCGTFDPGACVTGCLEVGPSICNAASVPARTCDQLKPEIRLYESIGSAGDGDGDHASGGGGFGARYGLCVDAEDCEAPLGCSQQTNTCAPCEANEDCAGLFGAQVCNAAQECEEVECAADDDCVRGPCNLETHECGECRVDADCTALLGGACDTKTSKCVECKKDSDCKSSFEPSCDVAAQECVECGEDAHCTSSFEPACDTKARTCVACNDDAHCTRGDAPACDPAQHACVECLKDAHCPVQSPHCDRESQTCRECLRNADCGEDAPRCDDALPFCTMCETNADCAGHDKPVCTISGACGDCENDDGCAQGEACDTFYGECVPEIIPP